MKPNLNSSSQDQVPSILGYFGMLDPLRPPFSPSVDPLSTPFRIPIKPNAIAEVWRERWRVLLSNLI